MKRSLMRSVTKNNENNNDNGSFQKRSILPPRRKFLPSGGGGEKKLFLVIVNVLAKIRTSEGGRGVNFLFPPWGWYGCFLE
jgi:hypothetical protein